MTAAPQPAGRWPCLASREGLVVLDVVVSPNARRTRADGLHDGALRVRLVAPPVDGKANALLLAWLAAELGLSQRALSIVRGATSRRKAIALPAGCEQEVARWLALRLEAP
jgi:uncharacterized protein